MTDRAEHILRSVFGYRAYRGPQQQIIERVTGGGDALVLMPTGGGKSLCYQIPAMVRPGVGIVVSPLIALMQDQVAALAQLGVRAAFVNSTLPPDHARAIEQDMQQGRYDLVYVAPERLVTDAFMQVLSRTPLALFAIDEAHCVSQWGHDFRPEYLRLAVLHERFADVPRIALTATADEPTRREILERLQLTEADMFVSGFDRPNIRYRVLPKANGRQQLLQFIRTEHPGDSGIVYCLTRRGVEQTAEWLADKDLTVLPYHAGLDKSVRYAHQQRFIGEPGQIVAATIAFGMGIDKPDVRFVAHLDVPRSIEAYYQETGRAGRDGLPADAWMAYGYADVVKLRQLLDRSEADEARKQLERIKLNAMLGYCETTRCRRQVMLGYLGDQLDEPCGNCDTCLEPVETWDGTEAAQKALSCVYRTDQTFGAAYLTDVLLGADDERIVRFGHDGVSTFGIGKELAKSQWLSVYRQLVAAGLLEVDIEHGSLRLTDQARPVLSGEQTVHFRKDPTPTRTKRRAKSSATRPAVTIDLTEPAQQELFDVLRAKRLELAQDQGVPPYVVFHDTTLVEMVHVKPQSLEAMGQITGIGEAKLQRFGQVFLDILQQHASP